MRAQSSSAAQHINERSVNNSTAGPSCSKPLQTRHESDRGFARNHALPLLCSSPQTIASREDEASESLTTRAWCSVARIAADAAEEGERRRREGSEREKRENARI
jgi:hypothetical protein